MLAIWHETLFMACWGFRNTGGHTLTSYSFDGELAARLVHRVGMEAVRGSSSRGGGEGRVLPTVVTPQLVADALRQAAP